MDERLTRVNSSTVGEKLRIIHLSELYFERHEVFVSPK